MSDTTLSPETESTETHETDLLIVGAGPSGLYAAYYAGFRGLSSVLMDSLPEAGGQVAAMYPEKLIYDVAGFPGVKGQELIDNCVEQAAPFDPTYLLGHRAEEFHRHDDETITITSDKGARVHAKAVIITGGIGTFSPKPLPAAEHFQGEGLVYFVPKLDVMESKDVLIVGGGDSAFDWAFNLQGIARSITLVHRRDRFRAHERTVEQVMESDARVITFGEVAKIHGVDEVKGVEIYHNQTEEREELDVQAIVAALGFKADIGPLERWGLKTEKRSLYVDTRMATNLPRVYAAGDITEYEGKVKLISVGFGEAATAVNNAAIDIDPNAKLFPGHSTNT